MANLTQEELNIVKERNPQMVDFAKMKGDNLIKCDLCHVVMRVRSTKDAYCMDCKRLGPLISRYVNNGHNLTEEERKRILSSKTKFAGSRTFGKKDKEVN